MNSANVILRLKKTIIYIDKILDNYPKTELSLKNMISKTLYDILELSYMTYYHSNKDDINYLKSILAKLKMIDFYVKISFDKGLISRKKVSNIGVNLRDITNMYYAWLKSYEKKV